MRFSEVDKENGLSPGTSFKYLEKAAQRWNYRVRRKTETTILLESEPDRDSGTIFGGIRDMQF